MDHRRKVILKQRHAIMTYLIAETQRECWVRDIYKHRKEQGAHQNLFQEMRLSDDDTFFDFYGMMPSQFDELLSQVGSKIKKQDTTFRKACSASERLGVTLRFLATGESQRSLSFTYRLGRSTVCKMLSETTRAIWDVLCPIYLPTPTEQGWREIAHYFDRRWAFPNCIGAINGKHIRALAPPGTGSRNCHVLLAMCDSRYCFTVVDIGSPGRSSDGAIFADSVMASPELLKVPDPTTVPGIGTMPHVIVGDAAFPLKPNIMRPYSGKNLCKRHKIFNYRLSRARRVIENAFGILAARWRIFRTEINSSTENINSIIQATVCLHNFMMCSDQQARYCPNEFADWENVSVKQNSGRWIQEESESLHSVQRLSANNSQNSQVIRDGFAQRFETDGHAPWQDNFVDRGFTDEEISKNLPISLFTSSSSQG
ncbi:Protein ALP1-like [Nymphon striatum]|nr:Protein ALP1-like [Nymphon striatum]